MVWVYDWRVHHMIDSAPPGVRLHYVWCPARRDSLGQDDLFAVGCRDWDNPDCPVWVYIYTGQAVLASIAAHTAEDSAARADAFHAAAEAAYRLALAAAGADSAAVDRAIGAARAADSASAEACLAASDAHDAALAAAAAAHDTDHAAEAADAARAAAKRAAAASRVADSARAEAEAAARDAGVSPAVVAATCGDAEDYARYRAIRDSWSKREQRMPRWRRTEACAGRFGSDPLRALEVLAAEYLGATVCGWCANSALVSPHRSAAGEPRTAPTSV